MWETVPQLTAQPVLELVPSVSGPPLQLYGYPNDRDRDRRRYYSSGTSTLNERWGGIYGAFHCLVAMPASSGSSFIIKIGLRYSMRLRVIYDYDDPGITQINGIDRIIGNGTEKRPYIEMAFLDGSEPMLSLPLHNILPTSNPTWIAGTAAGFGFVLSDDGCKMYGFALNHRQAFGQSTPAQDATCFGAGTIMRVFDVDEADSYGRLSLEMTATEFYSAMAHRGPFISSLPYTPETTAEKRARQGTRIASLRSSCLNWSQPLPYTGNQSIATVDCAGHGEFIDNDVFGSFFTSLYVASRQSQSTAFLKPAVTWNSNLSNSHEDNERLARLAISLSDSFVISWSGVNVTVPGVSWTATTENSGNNEYVAFRTGDIVGTTSTGLGVTYERQNVLVSLFLFEEIGNRNAATLDDVTLAARCRVTWTVWLVIDEFDGSTPSNFRDLSEAEFASLLAGDPVEIYTGLTIQGIGPA